MLWPGAHAEGPEVVGGIAGDSTGAGKRSEVPREQRYGDVQKESEVSWY